ncbi:MAG: hypothetical protein NZ742_11515, partial [Acidobacteria bacterium]|nr:hypothetical protein [Acidobacteriota bacterium]MDW7985314.1 hypothetical protein [Acidobacteriota bacterium]
NSIKELIDKNNIVSGCNTSPPGFPPRFLRKAYPEPFQGEWQLVCQDPQRSCPDDNPLSPNPIKGVRSLDPGEAIIVFDRKTRHDAWQFVYEAGTSMATHPCMTIPLE